MVHIHIHYLTLQMHHWKVLLQATWPKKLDKPKHRMVKLGLVAQRHRTDNEEHKDRSRRLEILTKSRIALIAAPLEPF